MGFADIDNKAAKPNGKAGDQIELTEAQNNILKREKDPQKRERLRQKMIANKRRELQGADTSKKEETKDAAGSGDSEKVTSKSGGSSTHSVEVKAPSINVNLPETTVAIHQARTWGQLAVSGIHWVQTFVVGAAAWALFGDGVLRAFGH
jgi:hypothetical protein